MYEDDEGGLIYDSSKLSRQLPRNRGFFEHTIQICYSKGFRIFLLAKNSHIEHT